MLFRYGFDLPQPRWGVLSGKSPRTSRRWRLFFVRRCVCLMTDNPQASHTFQNHL